MKVFRLRYEIYVEEMSRPQRDADHEQRQIRDAFDDNGFLFMAEEEGRLVGTIRINFRKDGPLECEELYELDRFGDYFPKAISMTTRLMVRASHRNTTVAAKLAMQVYDFAHQSGIQFDIIDCNPHLVRLYQQLGHRFYRPTIQHPDYGTVVPMVMTLEDTDYFEQVRSPLRRIQRRYPNSSDSAAFFQQQFNEYASIYPSFVSTGNELLDLWRSGLESGASTATKGLMENLAEKDITQILNQFDSLDYKRGDIIIRQGEESHGMFFLLSGSVAVVVAHRDDSSSVVDLLYEGKVFGEMGFITQANRNATIRAEEATRVLVLTRSEFTKLTKSQPTIAIQLLNNLFSMVVTRFDKAQKASLRSRADQTAEIGTATA